LHFVSSSSVSPESPSSQPEPGTLRVKSALQTTHKQLEAATGLSTWVLSRTVSSNSKSKSGRKVLVLSVCGSAWFNLPVPALTTHTTTRQRGYSAQLQTYCEVRRLGRPPLTASTVSRVKSLPICCTRALSCCGPFLDPISLHTCGLSLHPATHRGSETPISKTTSKKKACGSLISRPPTLSLSPPALRFAERALGPSHSSTGPDHTPPLPPPPPCWIQSNKGQSTRGRFPSMYRRPSAREVSHPTSHCQVKKNSQRAGFFLARPPPGTPKAPKPPSLCRQGPEPESFNIQ
jgi:hypothetical protein